MSSSSPGEVQDAAAAGGTQGNCEIFSLLLIDWEDGKESPVRNKKFLVSCLVSDAHRLET